MKKILIPLLLATATSISTPNYNSIETSTKETNIPQSNLEAKIPQDTIDRKALQAKRDSTRAERKRAMAEDEIVYHKIERSNILAIETNQIFEDLAAFYYNTPKETDLIEYLNKDLDIYSLKVGDSIRVK